MPVIKNKFQDDIKSMLMSHLKDQQLLKIDHVTPYGYRVDFVLHFDRNRKPVPPPREESAAAVASSSVHSAALAATKDSINK